jgi:hypothetical protein
MTGERRNAPIIGTVRRVLLPIAVAAALCVSGVVASSAPARSCGTVAAPGFHAFYVTTKHISCTKARHALKVWLLRGGHGAGPKGWHCKSSYTGRRKCTRRTAVITFVFHSY